MPSSLVVKNKFRRGQGGRQPATVRTIRGDFHCLLDVRTLSNRAACPFAFTCSLWLWVGVGGGVGFARVCMCLDSFPGVGSDSVLVQHGEEALSAEETRHHEDHVSCWLGSAPFDGSHVFVSFQAVFLRMQYFPPSALIRSRTVPLLVLGSSR